MKIKGISKISGRSKPWRVRYDDGSKVRLKHFETERLALDWAKTNETVEDLKDEERMIVTMLRRFCAQENVDMLEAATQFKKLLVQTTPATVKEAIAAYEDSMIQRNIRKSYREHSIWAIKRWLMHKDTWPISEFSPTDVVLYIEAQGCGEDHRLTIRNRIVTFLNFCKKNKWTNIDTKEIRWIKPKQDRREIKFYTKDQVRNFIESTPEKLRFCVALLFYTGIRPKGEISRLKFSHIDPVRKVIEINSTVSKVREPRLLYDIPEVFWNHYFKVKVKRGLVCPMNYRNFRSSIKKVCDKLEYDWPHDCTRHTFATHAFHRGIEWALDMMGHKDSRLFLTRYKGKITKEMSDKFWE